MQVKKLLFALFIAVLAFGCDKMDKPDPTVIPYGKNVHNITVDGIVREYIVQIPQGYKESPLPVVIMLHGTSGDGQKMYDITGWKELGETENFITVYPSSLKPCIIDEGVVKNITKWNSQPSEWSYCNGEIQPDDIKFLRQMIDDFSAKYAVDGKRIYLVGFSNGGQMAAKCSVFLSDKLAAIVEEAGSFSTDTVYTPKRRLPTAFQVGNKDYGADAEGPEISLTRFDSVLIYQRFSKNIHTHQNTFGISTDYTVSGDTSTAMVATYASKDGNPNVSFRFVFVKGLGHAYPNGTNHWMEGAKVHWNWLKQYSLP